MTASPDIITAAALEAEKTLPPKVVPRSGPLEICEIALLDRDGNVIATQRLNQPVTPTIGSEVVFPSITFLMM